jgi:hypothetical protein
MATMTLMHWLAELEDPRDGPALRYNLSELHHLGTPERGNLRPTCTCTGHWGIESMHWSLDMTFAEDACL